MKQILTSLAFKIWVIIVVAELSVLTIVGSVYIRRFSAELDAQMESQVMLPGKLMNAGLLSLASLVDEDTMHDLVGEALLEGWAVNEHGRIFASLNPEYQGKNIADIPDFDMSAFDFANPQQVVLNEDDAVVSISPIFRPDEPTPRLFTYIKVSTDEANAAKQASINLFAAGSFVTVLLTSLIIFFSFKFAILNRINDLLATVNQVESGNLQARAQGKIYKDEIGALQQGINVMAGQLEGLVYRLESQVAERTLRLEKSLQEMKTLYTISQRFMQTKYLDELLAIVVEETAIPVINRAVLGIFVYDEQETVVGLRIHGNWYRGDGPEPAPVETYVTSEELDAVFHLSQEPVFLGDIQSVPGLSAKSLAYAQEKQLRAIVFVPLWSQARQIGVLILQGDDAYKFTEEEIRPFYSIGSQVAAVVQNYLLVSQLEEKVAQRTEELSHSNEQLQAEIVERKEAEAKLQTYTQELERSNRELQEFAYASSHDLQEPLRKIQTFSTRLQTKYAQYLDEKGQLYLERMANSAERMQTLITDLLSLSRVSPYTRSYTCVDLNQTVTDVLYDLELQIEETKAVIQRDNLPEIEADPSQMYQLFQNLLSNALKFHRPGLPPQIVIECLAPEPGRNGAATAAPERYTIAVQDNGIGFEARHAERIFAVFQRLHGRSDYAGTGVGLAVCRKIVEQHNGSITAHSQLGEGTTFMITLPVKQAGFDARN